MSEEDKASAESSAADAIMQRLTKIEASIDEIVERLDELKRMSQNTDVTVGVLDRMSTKMHVAAQMIMEGKSNREIGEVLCVNENGAKVHVRNVAAKLGVNSRGQIVAALFPLMKGGGLSEERYERASGGLPIDWAERVFERGENDKWRKLYLGKEAHELNS